MWWGVPAGDHPVSLDCLVVHPSVTDPVALAADLVSRGIHAIPADARPPEYHLFLEADWRSRPDAVAAVDWRLAAAARAGLGRTVERLRYEWRPDVGVPGRSRRLTFESTMDDEVFVDAFRRIAAGSLDAHTRGEVVRLGADAYARDDVRMYRTMPGDRAWWRLAYDPSGALVGVALPSANDGGPVVGYLGVLPEYRGNGYVDDLLAEITAWHAGRGAQRIVADTDTTNTPMAAAFDRAGYRVFAIRIVASPSPAGSAG